MTHLLLIRHGETDWNVEGRWQGQADVPLNARGKQQAINIARRLHCTEIHAIYASDLQRAWQTARALARLNNLPICSDTRLREIDQGEWEGLLIDEIRSKYAQEFHRRRKNPLQVAPPGGETTLQVQERVLGVLTYILEKHPDQTVAIVSHGFVIAVARTYLTGKPVKEVWGLVPENGAIIELDVPGLS
jgi:broad specificity phosphatase PhoE